jgi:hypothetical protein
VLKTQATEREWHTWIGKTYPSDWKEAQKLEKASDEQIAKGLMGESRQALGDARSEADALTRAELSARNTFKEAQEGGARAAKAVAGSQGAVEKVRQAISNIKGYQNQITGHLESARSSHDTAVELNTKAAEMHALAENSLDETQTAADKVMEGIGKAGEAREELDRSLVEQEDALGEARIANDESKEAMVDAIWDEMNDNTQERESTDIASDAKTEDEKLAILGSQITSAKTLAAADRMQFAALENIQKVLEKHQNSHEKEVLTIRKQDITLEGMILMTQAIQEVANAGNIANAKLGETLGYLTASQLQSMRVMNHTLDVLRYGLRNNQQFQLLLTEDLSSSLAGLGGTLGHVSADLTSVENKEAVFIADVADLKERTMAAKNIAEAGLSMKGAAAMGQTRSATLLLIVAVALGQKC